MQILVFNLGSTSLKYKLFAIKEKIKIIKEREYNDLGEGQKMNHQEALRAAIRGIGDLTNIAAIGHRVVHGGDELIQPTVINQNNLGQLEKYNNLAPLHNPHNLLGIKLCLIYLGHVPNIAVFDTAFFKSLPLKTRIYPIPFKFYKNHGIQRFGFHGISHQYVAEEAAKKLKRKLKKLKLISCHLGGGCSIAAIKNGQPIDTSMGLTPLEGLMMTTRVGDIDPGIILEIQRIKLKENENNNNLIQEMSNLLYNQSGIKGIANVKNYLELLRKRKNNPRAKLAFEIFVYRIQKYLAAYWGILGGANAVIFTGKIGSGKPITRQSVCKNLPFLKQTKILSIPTDEELAIARECTKILKIPIH